jgi:hypothetical protein
VISRALLTVLVCCAFAVTLTAAAQVPSSVATGAAPADITLTVTDLTPKFLAFYDAVEREQAGPERRWELWKELYDFAAVPPTEEGQAMARALLDKAWLRYPSLLAQIRAGAAAMSPKPEGTVRAIAELLRPQKPATVRLLIFVGGFEENAFTAAQNAGITVALPVEMSPEQRALVMTHELTHAVHIAMGSFSGGWQRSIGTTVLTEGLAMRVTQKLFPSRPDKDFVEMSPGWLAQAKERRTEILRNIRPHLLSDKNEDLMRFTMGRGPTGLEREAYYAGWEVVGHWLAQGMSFAEIARIPENEMPKRVGEAIDALLSSKPEGERQ